MGLRPLLNEERLDPWLHDYNFYRPDASLNLNPCSLPRQLESQLPLEPPQV